MADDTGRKDLAHGMPLFVEDKESDLGVWLAAARYGLPPEGLEKPPVLRPLFQRFSPLWRDSCTSASPRKQGPACLELHLPNDP
jgi:hypothetical protein